MANLKLSDKFSVGRDSSDLKELRVNGWMFSISVIIVAAITWLLTSIMMRMVLHANHYLIATLTKEQLFSQSNIFFITTIVFFATIRSYFYQLTWFKDAFGDGASKALKHFHETYSDDKTPDAIIDKTFSQGTFTVAIKRVLVTIMTLGVGGSGGIEGPAIPVGQHIGAGIAKVFKVKDVLWLRVLEMCGISAAITTLLHAPLTGAVFALELVFGCKFVYRLLICSFISSLVAFILSNHILDAQALFNIQSHAVHYTPFEYLMVVVVTVFASIPSGIGLLAIFALIRRVFAHIPTMIHAPIGAFLCAITAIFMYHYYDLNPHHILGVGEETIVGLFETAHHNEIAHGWQMLVVIVVLKLFLTGFTIISGGSAGLLVPAIFVGSVSSSALFHILTIYNVIPIIDGLQTLFMVTGIASSLICVMDLPIATVLFVGELFDFSFIAPCIIAVAISRMLSQKIKAHFS